MFIRIHKPKTYQSGNSGSSTALVTYLEKENELDGVELQNQEYFFSHTENQVGSSEVINRIDKNIAKLTKKDTKFYMLSVNPSQKEQEFLARKITGRDVKSKGEMSHEEAKKFAVELREYSRNVMQLYAENFNKGLEGKDLIYFGKVEHERKYSRFDEVVKNGEKKAGEIKEGFQSHVHIIVSRKDATNKIRLSPLTNHRNSKNILNGEKVQIGFDRQKFVKEGEQKFDTQFAYQRFMKESFRYRHSMKNGMASVARSFANQMTGGAYMKAYGARINYQNLKEDPLRVLSNMMHKNTQFRSASKMVQLGIQPEKILVEAIKKVPQVVSRSATIKM